MSLANAVFLSLLFWWNIYNAYRGMGQPNDNLANRFMLVQGIEVGFRFYFGLAFGFPANMVFFVILVALLFCPSSVGLCSTYLVFPYWRGLALLFMPFWLLCMMIEFVYWLILGLLGLVMIYIIYDYKRNGPRTGMPIFSPLQSSIAPPPTSGQVKRAAAKQALKAAFAAPRI